ncbi:MAG: 4Fe-4S dicluster domain-containing protein [Candidatus Omnitrophica bacterium]|nr:4Fe-4S dicluster domain-containing protein [Candidatus Omnitrophota bacterium]
MQRIITKKELFSKIEELLKDYEVIGPKEIPNKGIFYANITDIKDLYLGNGFTIEPIKKFFLNPSEWLFCENFGEGGLSLENTPLPENRRIIIGARPCETRGLTLLDKVFNSDYKDNFYLHNRQRTFIVGLGCIHPDKSCFCTSLDGSPVELKGMDAYLLEIGPDTFFFETINDGLEDIFSNFGREFTEEDKDTLEKTKHDCINRIEKKIRIPETLERVFESDYWSEVSFACISCGICTYLCPTCHCFDLLDEERKRLRCYDGCAFKDFTLQASGENPRPTKRERYRQRVFHKFDYFKKNFGENLCVGCGRCIRYCPVKMDIAEIVNKIPVTRPT